MEIDLKKMLSDKVFIKRASRLAVRRFAEMLFICVALSAIVVFLALAEILNSGNLYFAGTFSGTVVFQAINVWRLRKCFFEVRDRAIYYVGNLIAVFVFALLNLIFRRYASDTLYTWIFAIVKFPKYMYYGLHYAIEVFVFDFINFIAVFASPIGMRWLFEDEEL